MTSVAQYYIGYSRFGGLKWSTSGTQSIFNTLTWGMPQDSVCGPKLINLCIPNVIQIVLSFGVHINCYADDLQFYTHCRTQDYATVLKLLLACFEAIGRWMGLNDTHCLYLMAPASHHLLLLVTSVLFDCEMIMNENVHCITCCFFFQLNRLHFVNHSPLLCKRACTCTSPAKLSSLFLGATAQVICKLQTVLNVAICFIVGIGRFDHVIPVLRDFLHWLLVEQCVNLKSCFACVSVHTWNRTCSSCWTL